MPSLLTLFCFCKILTISVLYVPILAWNSPLMSSVLLEISIVFPTLLSSSISLHCSFKKTFLSLLAILWRSAFSWVYLTFFSFPLASLLSSTVRKAFSDNHFASLHFFSFGMLLVTGSCTMLWTSIDSSSGTLKKVVNSAPGNYGWEKCLSIAVKILILCSPSNKNIWKKTPLRSFQKYFLKFSWSMDSVRDAKLSQKSLINNKIDNISRRMLVIHWRKPTKW